MGHAGQHRLRESGTSRDMGAMCQELIGQHSTKFM